MARNYTLTSSTQPSEESLLDGLNPTQAEAASHVDGPLLILAGAGSGKTRVMTHRIAYLITEQDVWPEQILAMTFTNKACKEMRERVDELLGHDRADESARITISTFHSLGARLLRIHARDIGLERNFVIYDDADQLSLIRNLMDSQDLGRDRTEARRLRGYIERMKNQGWTPEQAHEAALDSITESDAFFYELYQQALEEANCLDFGDLILGLLRVFRTKPKVAKSFSQQWRYVMVDEFQDTNPAQYELLKHLTSTHENLAVVGDDDQAIYRWRGATVANILGFEEDFGGAKVVKLEQNYRSTQTILDAANDVIQNNSHRRSKKLWTDQAGGDPLIVFTGSDDREEATYVAERIGEMTRNGHDLEEIAVFYRTNAQGRAFEEQLRFAGIMYQIIGGISFYAREEIKDLMAYLKVALNPTNEVDLLRILNKPTRGIGQTSVNKLRIAAALPQIGDIWTAISYAVGEHEVVADEAPVGWLPGLTQDLISDPALDTIRALKGKTGRGLREFWEIISDLNNQLQEANGLASIVAGLLTRISYLEYLIASDPERAEDKSRNVGELISAIEDFQREYSFAQEDVTGEDMLRAFLDRSSLVQSVDNLEGKGAVTLMTVHGSKGLEFESVFLAGMEDEIFPSLRGEDPEELDEERRLAYVAITRAKRRLTITNAKRRRVFGQFKNTSPSRFIMEIDEERLEVDRRSTSRTVDYSTYGQTTSTWGGRSRPSRSRASMSPDNSMWEFDQSQPMIKQSARKGSEPEYDEYSQVNPFDLEPIYVESDGGEVNQGGDIVGKTVTHPQFGVGKVKSCSGSGEKARLTIRFPQVGEKKIIRKFVRVLG